MEKTFALAFSMACAMSSASKSLFACLRMIWFMVLSPYIACVVLILSNCCGNCIKGGCGVCLVIWIPG